MIPGLEGNTGVEERLAPRTDGKAYHYKVFWLFIEEIIGYSATSM